MQFKTSIEIPEFEFDIQYKHQLLSLGSCFAQHIADHLAASFYNVCSNPFGTLYNPLSIRNSLGLLLNNYTFSQDDLFQHKGKWNSFQHHSSFSHPSASVALQQISTALQSARQYLQRTDVLMLTFGTAWVYQLKKQGAVVSNCHQLPASRFTRRRMTVNEIVQQLLPVLNYLKSQLPHLQVILSVSPVRYLKDGFSEHQVNKSTLLLAVHQLVQQAPFVHYFPSYEILIDDLRDYRYYKDDMIHPSSMAINYVWECFQQSLLSSKELPLRKKLNKLRKAVQHRPLHPESSTHQQFIQAQLKTIQSLQQKHPFLPLQHSKQSFLSQLNTNAQ